MAQQVANRPEAMWNDASMMDPVKRWSNSSPVPYLRMITWFDTERPGQRWTIYRGNRPTYQGDMVRIGFVDRLEDDVWGWCASEKTHSKSPSGTESSFDDAVRTLAAETYEVPEDPEPGAWIVGILVGIGAVGIMGWILLSSLGLI
ncbi:hypothetical protein ACFVAJ_11080 [Agromyces sp. NPDC057679]|uniref:hypothetical protein n=1 Tax=Agromyces sp. NPDC057679 TaxID=3346207 RepID=UPI00366BF0A0